MLASAAAVAEVPGRLDKVFLNNSNKLNKAGIYAVNIFQMGVPHTIVVDDYIPYSTVSKAPSFSSFGADNSIWGSILEKVTAKLYGNYSHIVGGNTAYGVRALIGGAYELHTHAKTNVESLWAELSKHDG